ncbi:hypothetical protein GE09DRAFT_1114714 [Coniochaeta sp. 2T2.1]|nr:hypothetical protein GE09DRAFT_1114714 [Coniochaeta sp. 2T2.1]
MKCTAALVALALPLLAASAAVAAPKPPPGYIYPAPCGRSVSSGVCTREARCVKDEGTWIQRDCPFYDVLDVGCCYGLPVEED